MSLTQVTMGVGAIGGACFFAILARLAQASNQHKQVMEALHKQRALGPEPPQTS